LADKLAAGKKAAAGSSSPKTAGRKQAAKKAAAKKPALNVQKKEPVTEKKAPKPAPAIDVSGEPRIGVFVCHCGTNITGFLDVEDVTEYSKTLPNVVFATRNLYTCAEDGISAIKDAIKEHDLNRVVVASCTPHTHEPLFRDACEEAGLNKYLFEFANIRDQCSWVHMHEWDEATAKARDLVRMSVMRAALLKPLDEISIDIHPAASMVIGAGYTGATIKAINGYFGNFDVTVATGDREETFKVGTIVVATGAEEMKPDGLYGYGELSQKLGPIDRSALRYKASERAPV